MKNIKIFASTFATLAVLAALLVPVAVATPGSPCTLYGYVTVNGVGTNGITVSCPGSTEGSYTTKTGGSGQPGYFQFDVTNGSHYTLSASYGGQTATQGLNANGRLVQMDLSISTRQPSPSPSPSASPSSTASPPSSGGTSTYENGAVGGNATVTPSPSAVSSPTSRPSVTATPASTVAPTPAASPKQQPSESSFPWWLLLILIAIIAVAAGAYFVLRKK